MAIDPYSAAIIGGTSLMGGLMANEQHYGPGDYLPNGWGQNLLRPMGDEIGNLQDRQVWGGERIAPIDPMWGNNLNAAAQFGLSGPGRQMMDQTWGAGQQGLGGIGAGMDYLGQMQGRGPNQFGFDQGTYDTIMGNLAPGVQNMFDVGARDIQQGFDFNVLPGLNMEAGLAGGYGGTKALQQSALGQAQTAGNIQNLGANLWQNAANQATQGGMTGGIQNLASANDFDTDLLQGYGRFGQMGGNMMNQAFNMGLGGLNMGLGAGGAYQDYVQSRRDAELGRFNEAQNRPWLDAQDRMALINMGAIGTPQTTGMSTAEGLMQGLNTGVGLYGMGQDAGWWGQPSTTPYVPAPTTGAGSPAWGGYFENPANY